MAGRRRQSESDAKSASSATKEPTLMPFLIPLLLNEAIAKPGRVWPRRGVALPMRVSASAAAAVAGRPPYRVGGRFSNHLYVMGKVRAIEATMTTTQILARPTSHCRMKVFLFPNKGQCRQIGVPWPNVRETTQDAGSHSFRLPNQL